MHPRTIGSVLEPPPPFPVLAVVVDAAAEVVGVDVVDALEADVDGEAEELEVEELVVVEDELLDVVEEDVEVVEVGWFARAEVTTVYTD